MIFNCLQITHFTDMGFPEEWVVAALGASHGDDDVALNILLQRH